MSALDRGATEGTAVEAGRVARLQVVPVVSEKGDGLQQLVPLGGSSLGQDLCAQLTAMLKFFLHQTGSIVHRLDLRFNTLLKRHTCQSTFSPHLPQAEPYAQPIHFKGYLRTSMF